MEPIFTRYLYEKRETMHALLAALLKNQMRESLFWSYELYLSGFEQETWDWIHCIYEEFYQKRNPRYERHLSKLYEQWIRTRDPDLIGSVVMTLSHRSSSLVLYFERFGNTIMESTTPPIPEKYVFRFDFLADYSTPTHHALREMSHYAIPKEITHWFMDQTELRDLPDSAIETAYLGPNWLYYCRETPIWAQHIREFGGRMDEEKKQVLFPDDDQLEAFYDQYGLEPDEQPLEIHQAHGIGVTYRPYSLEQVIEQLRCNPAEPEIMVTLSN